MFTVNLLRQELFRPPKSIFTQFRKKCPHLQKKFAVLRYKSIKFAEFSRQLSLRNFIAFFTLLSYIAHIQNAEVMRYHD